MGARWPPCVTVSIQTESIQKMPDKTAITLATVAEALGVSRTTVSNAYNRPDQLSPELRERVLETARSLGYAGPDPVARTLRRGRTGAIGLMFGERLSYAFTDPAAVRIFGGVAQTCEQHGSGLLMISQGPEAATGLDVVRTALVDGFLVGGVPASAERIEVVVARRLPFVVLDAPPHPGGGWVGIDDRGGARTAAEHLLRLGHRRFAVISAPLAADALEGPATMARQAAADYHGASERLAGYREALEAAGIDWTSVPVEERLNRFRAGGVAAAALLDRPERPTAILSMTDELALGALAAARERGVDVPRALSIVGFDDTVGAARSQPPLTTIRQPLDEKGAIAARLLLEQDGAPGVRRELPTELVVRASTAPPSHS
jgi:DNA-binding LacI/PurR family transcriptional regulator